MKIFNIILTLLFFVSCSKKNIPNQPTDTSKPDPVIVNGKKLYNGIQLADVWPPIRSYQADLENGMHVPYLINKPDTIDITVGRQLFVDDFLIEHTTMVKEYHQPEYHKSNPILIPDKTWEDLGIKGSKFAAPFSDGIWYDELDSKYKMWYMAGGGTYSYNNAGVTCYAESSDGINWVKPNLSIISNTNIVDLNSERDANVIWLDKQETNNSSRYKMFISSRDKSDQKWKYTYKTSSDGKLWREVSKSLPIADRSTVYKNSFRNNWVYSIRHNIRVNPEKLVRARDYFEYNDPIEGTRRAEAKLTSFWFGPWPSEQRHPKYPNIEPAIYNLDATPYESIMVGYFSIWQGPENDVAANSDTPKRNEIMVGYSRDGYHWLRSDMNAFMPVSSQKSDWNAGNLQSVVGSPIIVGDDLYFYLSGRRVVNGAEITTTGLATMRRDGFVSIKSRGNNNGTLTTSLFKFKGEHFFINMDIQGSLQIELLDKYGTVIKGYEKDACKIITGNSTKKLVTWANMNDLSSLKGKAIKARFYLTNGDLYSFWISPYSTGESNGYTAGGGPNLHSRGIDTK